jgi:hypothetical protein
LDVNTDEQERATAGERRSEGASRVHRTSLGKSESEYKNIVVYERAGHDEHRYRGASRTS